MLVEFILIIISLVLSAVSLIVLRENPTINKNPLKDAIQNNDLELVKKLLNEGTTFQASFQHPTILFFIVDRSNVDMLELVVNTISVDFETLDYSEETVLHKASNNNLSIMEKLIELGANVNAIPCGRDTVLRRMVNRGLLWHTRFLLQNGADPNIRGYRCSTPLSTSLGLNNSEISMLLMEYGADINLIGYNPAITLAAEHSNIIIMRRLIELGADINDKNTKGNNSIHIAVYNSDKPLIEFLYECNADFNLCNYSDRTPLQITVDNCKPDIVQLLINCGADVNYQNSNLSALESACKCNKKNTVKVLLQSGMVYKDIARKCIEIATNPIVKNDLINYVSSRKKSAVPIN